MAPSQKVMNIQGTTPVDDPEYRYKMPVIYGKIEGRGNGIKTVLPNISDVALALHRSPGEVNKFFGCELGAQTSYTAETDRAVVNGAHADPVLMNNIRRYIELFVLCPKCGLPETDYKIKSEIIWHRCAACGAKEMVDMSHKLCTYILAQNKKQKKEAAKKKSKGKSKGDKDEGSTEKKEKKEKKGKKEKKEKKEKKKKKDKAKSDDEKSSVDDEEVVEVDDDSALLLAVNSIRNFMKENPNSTTTDIVDLVVNEQMASGLKSFDKIHIITQSLLTESFYVNKEIEKHSEIFEKIINGNSIMERHLISALEGLCISKPKNFPVMVKQFYDEDVIEEDTIMEWAGEGRTDYTLSRVDEEARAVMRSEAEPFVIWLQEAESDSDDSDDE